MPTLSERAKSVPASPIRKLAPLAQAARARGVRPIPLNIGQPDTESPAVFLQAMREVTDKTIAYEDSGGNSELRERWSHWLSSRLKTSISATELLITAGGSEALFFAAALVANPGEEILVPDPSYANYQGFAAALSIKLSPIPCELEDGFSLPDADTLESLVTPKTRALLLCSPNNPTGTIYTPEEFSRAHKLCERRDLFLIVDETYRELRFDNQAPASALAQFPNSDRVIVIDSLSKLFSLCGARIGAIISRNQEINGGALRLGQARLAVSTLEQRAAVSLFTSLGEDYIREAINIYRNRRDSFVQALAEIPGVSVPTPHGAFYCVARLPVKSSEEFAKFLLEQFSHEGETVFIAPAKGFYLEAGRGETEARLAYVIEEKRLLRATELITIALQRYS